MEVVLGKGVFAFGMKLLAYVQAVFKHAHCPCWFPYNPVYKALPIDSNSKPVDENSRISKQLTKPKLGVCTKL